MVARTLIDTNILVYRYDGRFPRKRSVAGDILREGIAGGGARISRQSIIELVAATTRGGPEAQLPDAAGARREAEELMAQFPTLYPDDNVLRTALHGSAAYDLSWLDAHLRAYAEVHGVEALLSGDFQPGRMYGTVSARNPFPAEVLSSVTCRTASATGSRAAPAAVASSPDRSEVNRQARSSGFRFGGSGRDQQELQDVGRSARCRSDTRSGPSGAPPGPPWGEQFVPFRLRRALSPYATCG